MRPHDALHASIQLLHLVLGETPGQGPGIFGPDVFKNFENFLLFTMFVVFAPSGVGGALFAFPDNNFHEHVAHDLLIVHHLPGTISANVKSRPACS